VSALAQADNQSMGSRIRIAAFLAILPMMGCVCSSAADADSWGGFAKRIKTTSRGDSTAVVVLMDTGLIKYFRERLPQSIALVPIVKPEAPGTEGLTRVELGRIYHQVSAATMTSTEVWVVGKTNEQSVRAARLADSAARMSRHQVLRDSLETSRGTLMFSRWVDLPGGVSQRIRIHHELELGDSIMAHTPKRALITRPFTRSELAVDDDTVSYYVAHLADTSFYSIGGCPDVELVNWNASERLGRMGPGIVPVLIERVADPNPFVRERVQDALLFATQNESILARTEGEYLKFYGQPGRPPIDIVDDWWRRFGHFWTPADSTR
jgi:hypothetical protein